MKSFLNGIFFQELEVKRPTEENRHLEPFVTNY